MIDKIEVWLRRLLKLSLCVAGVAAFLALATYLENNRIEREAREAKQEAERKQKQSDELIRRCREEFSGKPILNRWLQFRGCTLP